MASDQSAAGSDRELVLIEVAQATIFGRVVGGDDLNPKVRTTTGRETWVTNDRIRPLGNERNCALSTETDQP